MSGRQGMKGKRKIREGLIPIDMAGCRVRYPRKGDVDGPQLRVRGKIIRAAYSKRRSGTDLASLRGGWARQEMEGIAIERGRD